MGSIPVRVTKKHLLCVRQMLFFFAVTLKSAAVRESNSPAARFASRAAKTALRAVFRAREISRTGHQKASALCKADAFFFAVTLKSAAVRESNSPAARFASRAAKTALRAVFRAREISRTGHQKASALCKADAFFFAVTLKSAAVRESNSPAARFASRAAKTALRAVFRAREISRTGHQKALALLKSGCFFFCIFVLFPTMRRGRRPHAFSATISSLS